MQATSRSLAHWQPVAFWSRKIIPAEHNYEMHDQELLAIVMYFKQWCHYLESSQHPICVLTNHVNLRAFMTIKELSRQQAYWAEWLAAFDFVIKYHKGVSNPNNDPSC